MVELDNQKEAPLPSDYNEDSDDSDYTQLSDESDFEVFHLHFILSLLLILLDNNSSACLVVVGFFCR
jgi:hypothetical protein